MQTTKTRTGCGCGGGCGGGCGCTGSGGCGCKPAPLPEAAPALCSPCDIAGFVRPRFFAGQLLTEDDLESLMDYVVAKSRFHNSRLFGAGVVCGLKVVCGPCDSTKIVVQPGYALDCCGNDLVLMCERTLDLAPLVRELMVRNKQDCKDPCAPPPKEEPKPGPGENESDLDIVVKRLVDATQTKHLCLYIKYAERQDQPVSSYPVGDDCDQTRCEPTRILEGVTFELRCPPKKHGETTLASEQQGCAQQSTELRTLAAQAYEYARIAIKLEDALTRIATKSHVLTPDELRYLVEGSSEPIERWLPPHGTPERATMLGQYLLQVGGPYARIAHAKLDPPEGMNQELLKENMKFAYDELTKRAVPASRTPLETTTLHEVARLWHITSKIEGDVFPLAVQMYMYGAISGRAVFQAAAEEFIHTIKALKAVGDCGKPSSTDCAVRKTIEELQVTWGDSGEQLIDFVAFARQLRKVSLAIETVVEGCTCDTVLPPCPPCDDEGVLLACFEIDQCKVKTICNTVRDYVVAPTTMGYWGITPKPPVEHCCITTTESPRPRPVPVPVPTPGGYVVPVPVPWRLQFPHYEISQPAIDTFSSIARISLLRTGTHLPLRVQLDPKIELTRTPVVIEDSAPKAATADHSALLEEVASMRAQLATYEKRIKALEKHK